MPTKERRYATGSARRPPRLCLVGHEVAEFWARVDASEECWLWTRARTSAGYGAIYLDGRTLGAHRVAYATFVGNVPRGLFVLHACDNPLCVRPGHLKVGTQKENMREKRVRERAAAGSRHGMSKLREDDVRKIFSLRTQGWTQTAIGKEVGVSQSHVSDVLSGRRNAWRTQTALRERLGLAFDPKKERA